MQAINLTPAEDAQLVSNGYEPIAVDGKAAVAHGWSSGPMTVERLAAMREAHPSARGTGLRTGHLAAIDIDVQTPEHAAAVKELAFEMLGETPLVRVGSKGFMLCYRNESPIRKVTVLTDAAAPGQFADKVEVLGTGLQFVAFGIHPTTQQPFTWIGKDQFDDVATPLTVPQSALPCVTQMVLEDFSTRCCALLNSYGYSGVRIRKAADVEKIERVSGTREDDAVNIGRAKEHLNNCVTSGHVATLGALGNDTIYELACVLMDRFYLSPDMAEQLMLEIWYPHCIPNTLEDELRLIVSHAASYIQNEPGARVLPPVSETFRAALDKLPEAPQAAVTDLGEAQSIVLMDENFDTEDFPLRADQYQSRAFPPLRELIPIWCERNMNTFLEGPSATQKSRSALQDAIALSAGLPVMGQDKTEPCECVYMNYENSPEEMARRVHMICKVLQNSNKDEPVSPKGVHIWELRKHPRPILVVRRDGVLITRFGRRFLSHIATRRNSGLHTLVVFDGLMDAIIFQDNTRNDDATAMALIRLIDSWCMEYDFTAYSIVHPSRSSERGNSIGSYATAWTTKPRAIQTFKRVLSPWAGGGSKAKITEDTPLADIFFQRRVQKRSNGPEGERMMLEYWKGGLRPHLPVTKPAQQKTGAAPVEEAAPAMETDDEVPF
jgi:RecA-family ATPase